MTMNLIPGLVADRLGFGAEQQNFWLCVLGQVIPFHSAILSSVPLSVSGSNILPLQGVKDMDGWETPRNPISEYLAWFLAQGS